MSNLVTCEGYRLGLGCPLRRSCKLYNNLLDLALEHRNISKLKAGNLITVLKAEFKTKSKDTECKNKK